MTEAVKEVTAAVRAGKSKRSPSGSTKKSASRSNGISTPGKVSPFANDAKYEGAPKPGEAKWGEKPKPRRTEHASYGTNKRLRGRPKDEDPELPEPELRHNPWPALKKERGFGTRGAITLSAKRTTKEELALGRLLFPPVDIPARPKSRTECVDGKRPCPFVSCKYHLYLDVDPRTGSVKLNFPQIEVWEMPETCALDVADLGGLTLEETGSRLNLTRERLRQLEMKALVVVKRGLPADVEVA